MEASVQKEYEMVHEEIVEIRTCITEYMKMFFALGIGLIGLFAFLLGQGFLTTATITSGSSNRFIVVALSHDEWSYLPLALAEIILFFASLLFHKFNTHNRGCGYMRALELERHRRKKSPAIDPLEIRLWQASLAVPFQPMNDFHWGSVDCEKYFHALKKKCDEAENKCCHPFYEGYIPILKVFPTIVRSLAGLWMIFRATIFRAQIRSWTFPFQIAFGPFMMTVFLLLTWLVIIHRLPLTANIKIQLFLLSHVLVSWLGLGYRMYRLCGADGDRTIELWCWRSMVQRYEALRHNKIDVEYVGWFPKDASTAVGS